MKDALYFIYIVREIRDMRKHLIHDITNKRK